MKRVHDSYERAAFLRFLDRVLSDDPTVTTALDHIQAVVDDGEVSGLFRAYMRGWGEGEEHSWSVYRRLMRPMELRSMPYREYLQTPEWAARRRAQIEADGGACRFCNATSGLQVHHRTYANRGNEKPGDLITVCRSCHGVFHKNRDLVKTRA